MKLWQKRTFSFIVTLILLVNGTYLVVANVSSLPLAVRGPVWRLAYNYLSVAPNSNEPYGVYVNKEFGHADKITVAFYDGQENHVLITRPGGDDHRHAAMLKLYHLRVSAPNDREAARLLREFLNNRGFKGSIRVALTFAHGAQARPMLGRTKLGVDLFSLLSEYRPDSGYADMVFVSCAVAEGEIGKKYIQKISDEYGIRVSASEKNVGWDFAAKWFKSDEGKRNFDIEVRDWWTAIPGENAPKRYSEVFTD